VSLDSTKSYKSMIYCTVRFISAVALRAMCKLSNSVRAEDFRCYMKKVVSGRIFIVGICLLKVLSIRGFTNLSENIRPP